MCRGCAARPCIMNCPKGAISSLDGKAHIDPDKCVQCGMCLKACPYHAIVFTPVPCADICPVHAISQKEDGTSFIDLEKCIHCGRCMQVCPFGAIMERSHIVDIALALNDPALKVVAIPAPSICGQFKATTGQILSAIRQIGFDEVLEAALGAEETARHEAAELKTKMEEGQPFMTSSCCPAYTEWVRKHAPELQPYVSETRSPMIYAARIAREKFPGAVVVFIGPCLAKRFEAEQSGDVDYVMSFEELGAFMVAGGVAKPKAWMMLSPVTAGDLPRPGVYALRWTTGCKTHTTPRRSTGLTKKLRPSSGPWCRLLLPALWKSCRVKEAASTAPARWNRSPPPEGN